MFERILASIKEKLNNTKILDRYILKQVIEMFLMGVFVFTTIIFASDTFITLIKQIAKFGIPFKVAFIMILLNLPAVIVMTIPMGVLLATVMTLNRLSLSSEITVMRACGIGLNRIAKPIFIFAIVMALSSFYINEKIVPVMTQQSTKLALWALEQKHVPDGKEINFANSSDQDVVFGEISADSIIGMNKVIYNYLYQTVDSIDTNEWGKIEPEQKKEFRKVLESFAKDINDTVDSLVKGVKFQELPQNVRDFIQIGRASCRERV